MVWRWKSNFFIYHFSLLEPIGASRLLILLWFFVQFGVLSLSRYVVGHSFLTVYHLCFVLVALSLAVDQHFPLQMFHYRFLPADQQFLLEMFHSHFLRVDQQYSAQLPHASFPAGVRVVFLSFLVSQSYQNNRWHDKSILGCNH